MGLLYGPQTFIKQVVFSSCSRPWWVFVVTSAPAFIKAVVTYKTIDLYDLLRMEAKDLVRHQNVRLPPVYEKRHGYKTKIVDEGGTYKKTTTRALHYMLRWTQPLETFGFHVLLFNVGTKFWYDWQALVVGIAPCDGNQGVFQREKEGGNFFPNALLLDELVQNTAGWGSNAAEVLLPAGHYWFNLDVSGRYHGHSTGSWRAVVTTTGSVGHSTHESAEVSLSAPGTVSAGVTGEAFMPFGGAIQWDLSGSPVPTGLTDASACITVMQQVIPVNGGGT